MVNQTKSIEVPIFSPDGKFYSFFKSQAHLLTKPYVAGAIVYSIELHGGTTSWDVAKGSQKSVTFQSGEGRLFVTESFVDEVEVVDDEAQFITFKVVQGDILNIYKIFKVDFQVITDAKKVIWTVTYQKKSSEVADPDLYLRLLSRVSKDVDSYLNPLPK